MDALEDDEELLAAIAEELLKPAPPPPPKRPRGRPPEPEPRDRHLDVRLTASEKRLIEEAAGSASSRPADWARKVLLSSAKDRAEHRATPNKMD